MTPTLIGIGKVRYSSIRASNSKWMLLEQTDGFIHLHKTDGLFVRVLPQGLRTDTQVVLSRVSPDILYYTAGNSIMSYSIPTNQSVVVATFPEFIGFPAGYAEGDLSEDEYLAIAGAKVGGDIELFAWLAGSSIKGTVYTSDAFDGIKTMGSHLIISKDSGIYDLTAGTHLTEANGHACPSSKGLLWCSAADAKINQNAVCLVRDGQITPLKSFSWSYAMHITAGPDFAGVSVYDPAMNLPSQIWKVPFDGSTATMLHEWRSQYIGYDSSPKATYSEGRLLYNVQAGGIVSVWSLDISEDVKFTPPILEVKPAMSRIDYSPYVGKSRFIMMPRPDGSVDIYEEKV